MQVQSFINQLRSQGRYSFAITELEEAMGINRAAALNTLSRLKKNKAIASPVNGFYVLIPPEYQVLGCLPADMFIADLMKYLEQPYYVGFLSAAQFYGAAHQKPQRFQIVVKKNRRSIQCGRIMIEFIANQHMELVPTQSFNTTSGTLLVASPESIALDMLSNQKHAAGIDHIATVLLELSESLKTENLLSLAHHYPEISWLQRLGYLLEFLGLEAQAESLLTALKGRKTNWVRLAPRVSSSPLARNQKWKLIINTNVEPDEI